MDNKEVLTALRDGLNAVAELISKMLEAEDKKDAITWVTCKQASIQTGVSLRTIQHWAYDGRIRTQRDGKLYLLCLEDVLRKIA